MVLIHEGGLPKWNNINLSMELLMTYINSKWGSYIYIENIGNGGNGIRKLMEATLLGTNL
jgi:hypothetical protein